MPDNRPLTIDDLTRVTEPESTDDLPHFFRRQRLDGGGGGGRVPESISASARRP